MSDPHHIYLQPHAYGVRSSVVERLTVAQVDVGSNPIARPMKAYRFTGELFTEPDCDFTVGPEYDCASVAQIW